MGAHSHANGGDLDHVGRALQRLVADFGLTLAQVVHGALIIRGLHREGEVRCPGVAGHDLDDHVHVDVAVGEGAEDARRHARLVGDAPQGDLRLVLREGDAGDDLLFHDLLLLANERSGRRVGRIVE